jgi:hypothetical protein
VIFFDFSKFFGILYLQVETIKLITIYKKLQVIMAKRSTKNQNGSEKVEGFENKVSLQFKRQAAALEKMCSTVETQVRNFTEELETLRSEFTVTEAEQAQAIETHKEEMARLEEEAKESAAEIITNAQVENYKELLAEQRKAQVEMSKYSRSDIHFSNDGGKK